MKSKRLKPSGWCLLPVWPIALLTMAACFNNPGYCVDGVELGVTYEVSVIESYDKNSKFTFDANSGSSPSNACGGFDLVGRSFRAKPTRSLSHPACDGRAASVSDVPDLALVSVSGDEYPNSGLMGSEGLTGVFRGACEIARWQMQLKAPDQSGDPLAIAAPGKVPPLVMKRTFVPSPTSLDACRTVGFPMDKNNCIDTFVVQLRKAN